MNIYKSLLKPLLFSVDPETAHDLATLFIKKYSGLLNIQYENPKLRRTVCNIHFKNPIGLAAGFDKNAQLIDHIPNLGFGFMEVGTITPKPQEGNQRPRMLRLKDDNSLINNMGFNNDGLDIIVKRLENRKSNNFIIGANIGKNKSTPNTQAHLDYASCFYKLQDVVDYLTINISSPNTPTLRELLGKDSLEIILESVQNLNRKRQNEKPIFLKISPDLNDLEIVRVIKTCEEYKISGIVSTNTTIKHSYSFGGLSGKLLGGRSNEVTSLIKKNSTLSIISSGGIMSKDIALERLQNADLIQLYTGLVYEGPGLTKEILKSL
jgi:dihydroorotate dehydrogenase